jgi:mannose/fructose-specific phosphotransferase system component IIA
MIMGIIVAHKDAAQGILRSLAGMYGEVGLLAALSNEGLSTNEMSERIFEASGSAGDDGVCVFVDVYGGSCWRAAKLARLPKAHVITGFNLPMLLSFVSKRESVSFGELPDVLAADGKRGIRID